MVEAIGALAAIAQLSKYLFDVANGVPELTRRFRQAPQLVRQWNDHAALIISLTQLMGCGTTFTDQSSVGILERCYNEAIDLHSLLESLMAVEGDGRFVKVKKRLSMIRKEKEIERIMSSMERRIGGLQKQIVLLQGLQGQIIADVDKSKGSIDHAQGSNVGLHSLSTSGPTISLGRTRRNLRFIGCIEILNKLSALVSTEFGSNVALCGLGGSGKSEIALEFAHQLHDCYPQMSIVWLNGRTQQTLEDSLRRVALDASITGQPIPSSLDIHSITSWLNDSINGPWLNIIDDIDFESFTHPASLEDPALAKCGGNTLLVTRNIQFALQHVHPSQVIEVPPLSSSDARELLLSWLGSSYSSSETEIDALTTELQHFPLAIAQAGHTIRMKSLSISEYLESWRNTDRMPDMFVRGAMDFQTAPLHSISSSSILLSLPKLHALHGQSLGLLYTLCCFHHSGLPLELLLSGGEARQMEEALVVLKAYFIINLRSAPDTIHTNQFAWMAVRYQLGQSQQRTQIVESALRLLHSKAVPALDTKHSIEQSHMHAIHLESVFELMLQIVPSCEMHNSSHNMIVEIITWLIQYFLLVGRFSEIGPLLHRTFEWGDHEFSNNAATFNVLQSKSGLIKIATGYFTQARAIICCVLRSQVTSLGEHHVDTLHNLNNLGVAYQTEGSYQIAERYHLKVLAIKVELYGNCHLETFTTINNLALALQGQEKHKQAEPLFLRALYGRKRLLHPNNVKILNSMDNLGTSLYKQGRLEESKAMHQAALTGRQTVLGPKHRDTLGSKSNLALILNALGQRTQAIAWMRDVTLAFKDSLGATHPDAILALNNLAIFLFKNIEYGEAELILLEVLALQENMFGRGDAKTWHTLQFLATLLHYQNRFQEALEMVMWLFERRREVLGVGHADTICSAEHVQELQGIMGSDGFDDSGLPVLVAY